MNDSDCLDTIRSTVNGACVRSLSNNELTQLAEDLVDPVETSCRLRALRKELYRLADAIGMEGCPDSDASLVKAVEKRMTQLSARIFTCDDGSYAEIVDYAGGGAPEGVLGSMTIHYVTAKKTEHRITLKREEFHTAPSTTPSSALKVGAPVQFAQHPRLFVSPPPVAAAELMLRLYAWEELTYGFSRDVLRYADTNGISIPQACVNAGVSPDAVLRAVAQLMGLPVAKWRIEGVDASPTAATAASKLPAKMAHDYNALPLRIEGNALVVATCDPANIAALDDLKFIMAIPQLRVELCSEDAFRAAFRSIYSSTNHDLVQSLLA